MNKCAECNKETINPKFCNRKCSAKYTSIRKANFKPGQDKRTKKVNCRECKDAIEVNVRASTNNCICKECGTKLYLSKKICNSCGSNKCTHPKICKKYRLLPGLIKYFGFDESVIGTIKIYEEFQRIKDLLENEYHHNSLSLNDLVDKYNHYDAGSMAAILSSLDIKRRNLSDASAEAYVSGKFNVEYVTRFKRGWHTTWDGNKVFYRSSYELEYAQQLDVQKIEYEMESKRFWYWDSKEQKQRTKRSFCTPTI